MGQKVNPNGLRYGIYRNWNSRWFAKNKDFATFLKEDMDIREFLTKELKEALLSHIEIDRVNTFESGYSVIVSVHVARVGVVIGQQGERVKELTAKLAKIVKSGEVKINVVDIKNPDLNASLVAQDIARQLEARGSFRIVQKRTIQRVRRAGAKGIKTLVSGRLNGAEIARSEGYKDGIIPLHTLRADIDYALAEAHTTYGRLGVKVWICRGEYDLSKGRGE
ncbi:MAG: 30S ribosomal protein S3 [Bacilli bacterium]|jgi:small subunit ribosomal protein S3|nr:30S ribosomal protein S3 [Bacillota bacterium]NLI51795.1 30S ribosomal protein S3 [Erysipelotrichaceae bacterium]OQC49604.1 MAG: 30S ribosomal protein S3 [Tenericutes bacterium ADurb.Bin024]HOH94814.1 30S ribosomal protein S3 [Bacilli bacterium]HOR57676.1 30S ribosomal protein S3 [bacterium]